MSEHNYKYTDENFSLAQAADYNLLLQIDSHSFSYAVTHQKKLLAWAENCPLGELKNPQELHDVLTAGYKSVVTGLSSTGFTLLPENLFDDEYVANLARLLDVDDTDRVYAQPFDNKNTIIYKVEQAITGALTSFGNESLVHRAKGWVAAIAGNYPTSTDLYLNIENGTVEILNFGYNRLRFYNSFGYKNHEELAYYSAFVAEELNLKPEDITLVLSGDVNTADKSFTYLEEFFGEVRINDTKVISPLEQIIPHKILSLAALSLCASSEVN